MLAMDRTGQLIGKYRLLRQLNRGRFADVYLCKANGQKQQRVLKLFHVYLFPDERQRFMQQAQALAQLTHPGIVPVRDFGVEGADNVPWLVMDYVAGATLRQRFLPGSRLPLSDVVNYAAQLAAALQYANDHGVVHQNMKSENIFFSPTGTLLLSDFALPVIMLHPSVEHDGEATLSAMPPEQSHGDAEPASDQYALAALIVEWLSGKRWTSLSKGTALHERLPALSPLVVEVLQTALQVEPTQRFRTVSAFATAFSQAYQESQGLPLQAPTAMKTVLPRALPLRRWGRLFLPLIAVMLLLGIALGLLIRYSFNVIPHPVVPVSPVSSHSTPSSNPQTTPTPSATHAVTPTAATTPVVTPTVTNTPVVTPTTATTPVVTPITSPTVGAGTLLYQANWSQGWSGSSDWYVMNNELFNNGSSFNQGAAPTIVVPYTVQRASYAVEMRARANATYPCFDAGILRGFSDASGWHGYKAAVCDQKIRLQAGNNNDTLITVPFSPGTGWHLYRFEAQGSHLRFFVDGTLLIQIDDTRYPSGGQVGLKSYGTYLEISDLKITAL